MNQIERKALEENAELKKLLESIVGDFGYYERKRIKELMSEGER